MSKEKYGFVYIWRDKKLNRFYIGSHWGIEDDGYICSSKSMSNAYQYRKQDFKRRILLRVYTNRDDLLSEEQKWLDLIPREEFGKKYYNKSKQTICPSITWTEKERNKMRNTQEKIWTIEKRKLHSEIIKEKWKDPNNPWKNADHSKSTLRLKKMNIERKGIKLGPWSEERKTKFKIRLKTANRPKTLSETHKRNIGLGLLGNKNAIGNTNFRGKSHSKESKQLMSNKLKGYVAAKSITTGQIFRVTKQEFDSNPDLVGANSKSMKKHNVSLL